DYQAELLERHYGLSSVTIDMVVEQPEWRTGSVRWFMTLSCPRCDLGIQRWLGGALERPRRIAGSSPR
ncbi:MAG: hypothetical protein R3349_11780, partial [Geminicoccaceae bacterium]|nr:hypothetical protein [Geminicoccaceae bacterium]